MGACLEQELEDGSWVPISFASRQLNNAEVKYSTSELELLAVVWSMYHFRYYLYGNRFELITDHKALLSALRNNRGNKTYQSRLVRWVDKLLPFDFTVSHLAGSEMGLTDYLSRNATGKPEPESNYDEKFVVASISNFFGACNNIRSKILAHDKKARQPLKSQPNCPDSQSGEIRKSLSQATTNPLNCSANRTDKKQPIRSEHVSNKSKSVKTTNKCASWS